MISGEDAERMPLYKRPIQPGTDMRTEEPRAIHLADYQAPDFHIETVHLDFALDPEITRVTAKLRIVRKTRAARR